MLVNVSSLNAGPFTGLIADEFDRPLVVDQLRNLAALRTSARAERISAGGGGDHVVRCPVVTERGEIQVAVKIFGRQPWWKDVYDRKNVSRAERSFRAACFLVAKGIGTPPPIACLERWDGHRLRESYYLCRYEPAPSFREILADILWNQRRHQALMDVLHHLAPAIRAMHDAGFMHGDMGNQNILMPRAGSGTWLPPQLIDLNRSKIRPGPIDDRERAYDLARVALPPAYVEIFKEIYSGHRTPPARLDQLERKHRRLFWQHRRSSKWRHPIRYRRNMKALKGRPLYPAPRDIWLWNEESAEPAMALGEREERRHRPLAHSLHVLWQGLRAMPAVRRLHDEEMARSYAQRRALFRRVGIALHPRQGYVDRELELHRRLGEPPVFVRFCHHETSADWERGVELVDHLARRGTPVMVGLVQDRRAVLEPSSWADFLDEVVRALAGRVTCFEVTHATNHPRWGVWRKDEYLELLRPAFELKREFPNLELSGPACSGSDHREVIASLESLPASVRFDALSHLVALDRRGAAEGGRERLSALEQCAMLKALARWSSRTREKVIVSGASGPAVPPGETDEDRAADMLRFLAVALCSGHVEQVYWWRWSAHGYGLVDDRNGFEPRPAFEALAFFLELLGTASFERRHDAGEDVHLLEFSGGGRRMLMGWCRSGERKLDPRFEVEQSWDTFGNPAQAVTVGESPSYHLLAGGAEEAAGETGRAR